MHIVPGELVSSLETFQLNEKVERHDFAAELADQTDRRLGRSTRGQQVINNQYALSRADGIPMDRQGVRSILEAVLHLEAIGRQLPRLSDRDKTRPEPTGQHAAEDKPPGLDSHHLIDPVRLITRGQLVRQLAEGLGIFQQGRNIVEENAGLGKIRHFADEGLIVDGKLRR